jgi:hypothetical protein
MSNKTQLDFLQQVTLGLFNKKGTSFNLHTQPYGHTEKKIVKVLIVNDVTTSNGGVLHVEISYVTTHPTVVFTINGVNFETINKEVAKTEAVAFLKAVLKEVKYTEKNVFSRYNDKIDFYNILNELHKEVFGLDEKFEFNAWRKTIYMKDALTSKLSQYLIGYGTLTDSLHVHGGVGTVATMNEIHDITTTVELATVPQNGIAYLGLVKNIAKNPLTPPGIYDHGNVERFSNIVIEQFKNAWNKK